MKKTTTRGEAAQWANVLFASTSAPLGRKPGYAAGKNLRRLMPIAQKTEKERHEAKVEFALKDDEGNIVFKGSRLTEEERAELSKQDLQLVDNDPVVDPEKASEYDEAIIALLDEEVEVEIHMVSIDSFPEGTGLSAGDYFNLDFMILEDDA